MPSHEDLTTDERRIVLAYREGRSTQRDLCAREGVTRHRLLRILARAGEPLRRRRPGRPARRRAVRRLPAAGERPGLAERLRRLLSERLDDLEARSGSDDRPDDTARALALMARTLATLQRASPSNDDADATAQAEPSPRSLCELRDELHGHLERVRAEERARRGLPPDEADPA